LGRRIKVLAIALQGGGQGKGGTTRGEVKKETAYCVDGTERQVPGTKEHEGKEKGIWEEVRKSASMLYRIPSRRVKAG